MMKKALHWLLYSNLFIGLCAAAYASRGAIMSGSTEGLPWAVILFAGAGAMFVYLLIRIVAVGRIKEYAPDPRWQFFLANLKVMHILLAVSGIAAAISFFYLPDYAQLIAFLPGCISVLYGLPLRFGKKQTRLRDIGYIKIFLIAFVWAYIGILLPVSVLDQEILNKSVYLFFIADFLYIIAITLPFDLKDMEIDAQHNVSTLPVVLGKENTNMLSMILLFIAAMLYTVVFRFVGNGEVDLTIPLSISIIISGMTILLAQRAKKPELYFGLLDGMLILQWALVASFTA